MSSSPSTTQQAQALRVTLQGQVQGLGIRPAIARLAERYLVCGFVSNTAAGVEIQAEGRADRLEKFQNSILACLPAAAVVSSLECQPADVTGATRFTVKRSSQSPDSLLVPVPTDRVVCEPCLQDINRRQDRRHGYAFTSCTDCGPRYSIIRRMPYERHATTMQALVLCEDCRREYAASDDRRFQAQTIACPKCGPQLWLRDGHDQILARSTDALRLASNAIGEGKIVALRGLGGYQLLVDATSATAVQRLRERKRRPAKPLAVMVASLADATRIAHLNATELSALSSRSGPIAVVRLRHDSGLVKRISEGMGTVGLLLPTTPLHWLLLKEARCPLVCTSGNREGDPIIFEPDQAIEQLASIADVFLEHDRPIERPIDDSVVRVIADRPVTLRAARGLTPQSLYLSPNTIPPDASLLALGGQQKSAVALCNGVQAVLGPHIGDLETIATRQRFVEQTAELRKLFGLGNCQWVGDLHPDYFGTRWAEEHRQPLLQVQHHHAHIVAGMLEHGWLDRQVLGIAFDGTGYGSDGTIWGGEALIAQASGFTRTGHLRTFALPGGERAVREPWRVATALVRDACGPQRASRLEFSAGDVRSLLAILQKPHLATTTSSVGRLFDGVAALVLGIERVAFEGQAAMMLEAVCDDTDYGRYSIAIRGGDPLRFDWRPLIRQLLADRDAGVAPGAMAMRFHRGLAELIFQLAEYHPTLPVVLGGGVFQNRVLGELLMTAFDHRKQPCGFPGLIPPGDGGLAAGQLAIAAAVQRQRIAQPCV